MLFRLALFCVLVPVAMARTSPSPAPRADSARFAALSDRFLKESLQLSPVSASSAGYHEYVDARTGATVQLDAELDEVSPAAFARQLAFYRGWQRRFARQTPAASLSLQDRADLRLIQDQIALALLELTRIQNYKHNPTVHVETIGNALFLPLTQEYAPHDVRVGHVLSRMKHIPRFLQQARETLTDADPIFIKVAVEENEGNLDLIENMVAREVPAGSALRRQYDEVVPPAIAALKDFTRWLREDLAKRPATRTWRLGKALYAAKFKYVMETPITPAHVLADAERDMRLVRAEMLQLSLPLHQQWFAAHGDHAGLARQERENTIIGEVLRRISDEHPHRDQLMQAVIKDLGRIKQFIRDKQIVALSDRDNLKVIPTPPFMRGVYSVAGFHSAPPLEPTAEAQYWVTPIDSKTPADRAESKLREYNDWTLLWLTIHEALPGHYIQFEHANNVQPERRRLLRNLLGNGPYIEGWAEYIAQVMMDEGFPGPDPTARMKFRLMMRKIRLRLLANTILDVRMQTMDMTDQQALALMMQDAFQTQAEAEGKLQRAKLSSAQLPTYYVGYRDWMALRKKYQARAGKDFNLLEFHNLVLDQGPLPIDSLEKIILPRR